MNDFLEYRKKAIKREFSGMNDRQFEAVTTVRGPLLVLAGAGSGKTTVLVNRTLNLIKYGDAYNSSYISDFLTDEDLEIAKKAANGEAQAPSGMFSVYPARPWEILAITFTNKAAGELKDRIEAKLGEEGQGVWAGTFHSICARILRRYADKIGYTSHFTIYDMDDQTRTMRVALKGLGLDEKTIKAKAVLSSLSAAKDRLETIEEYTASTEGEVRAEIICKAAHKYMDFLKSSDAMDFDDLIINTVKLLQTSTEAKEYYQNRFKYIMVDEYQDTNHAQYMLCSLLAGKYNNLCVVGDDDQSIYRFRGATIENILSFEDEFKNARVIRLEQNYRSTENILDAANAVISHNKGRKGKELWTDIGEGSKITVYTATDEKSEARYIADKILENVKNGDKFADNAVLYRTNRQSQSLESVFARSGIAYKVIGGFRFFERKEVKDVVSYLSVIANNADEIRLRRVINEPKRGIGETTIAKMAGESQARGVSLFEAMKTADQCPFVNASTVSKLKSFTDIIDELTEMRETASLAELCEETLKRTGYLDSLIAQGEAEKDRVENVKELVSSLAQYEAENEEPSLEGFLEEVALVSDIDSYDEDSDYCVMMTVHSAKGLEFKNVFLSGMEEGMFPGDMVLYGDTSELEEERRLAYVAITRAKRSLTLTNTESRYHFGQTRRNPQSRFVNEIPTSLCEVKSENSFGSDVYRNAYSSVRKPAFSEFGSSFSDDGTPYFSSAHSDRPNAYKPKKPVNRGSSYNQPEPKKNSSVFTIGMTVTHKVFGKGTVISAMPMGSDTLLEINFEGTGRKKVMASYVQSAMTF